MVCGSCVDKLARKLVLHHKIDLIRAYELSEKAVERVEAREKREKPKRFWWLRRLIFDTNLKASLYWRRWIGKGFNPDYTQACAQSTCALIANACNVGGACEVVLDCTSVAPCSSTGSCGCPAPLPNSSQVSGCTVTCDTTGVCTCRILTGLCTKGSCAIVSCPSGTCGYNCTPPYVWNGSACVLVLPAKPLINMPLVNPVLVNVPIVRALKTKSLQLPLELQLADMFL